MHMISKTLQDHFPASKKKKEKKEEKIKKFDFGSLMTKMRKKHLKERASLLLFHMIDFFDQFGWDLLYCVQKAI